MISGARNSENGSAIFLEPKTDVMVQFLAPEIVIMGERNFMLGYGNYKSMALSRGIVILCSMTGVLVQQLYIHFR